MATVRNLTLASTVTTASQLGDTNRPHGPLLPTATELAELLPWPGIPKGATITVSSLELLFALIAPATTDGSWAAAVGLPDLGIVAAAEAGIDLTRFALVPHTGDRPDRVIATLLDGMDIVAIGTPERLHERTADQLSKRARHHGSVLLPVGTWPHPNLQLRCSAARWHGIGTGHGRLDHRSVTVTAAGRGAATKPQSGHLLLPDSTGGIRPAPHETDHTTTPSTGRNTIDQRAPSPARAGTARALHGIHR